MKLIKEVHVTNPMINISINPETQQTNVYLEYRCPDCSGYGCRNNYNGNKECVGGTITKPIDLSKIDSTFEPVQAMKIKVALQNIYFEAINK